MKTVKWPVVLTQDEQGYFIAEAPVLKSCFTQGKTKVEALENIKEVIHLFLECMAESGEAIPEKYSLEQIEVAV